MPNTPVLYLGDTDLTGGASYLAGLLTHWGYRFDHVPSAQRAEPAIVDGPRRLFIFSDYPAAMIDGPTQQRLLRQVNTGAGLVMIGGWESFCGQSGRWHGTPIASALPVLIGTEDDRINCDQPAVVVQTQYHPIAHGLPWRQRPPIVGGFNQIQAKPDGNVVLEIERFNLHLSSGSVAIEPTGQHHPLLVTGTYGQGRTAALATDLAPHWVGPWVDWGDARVVAHAPGSHEVEVGNWYTQFVWQLLAWVGRLDEASGQANRIKPL